MPRLLVLLLAAGLIFGCADRKETADDDSVGDTKLDQSDEMVTGEVLINNFPNKVSLKGGKTQLEP